MSTLWFVFVSLFVFERVKCAPSRLAMSPVWFGFCGACSQLGHTGQVSFQIQVCHLVAPKRKVKNVTDELQT